MVAEKIRGNGIDNGPALWPAPPPLEDGDVVRVSSEEVNAMPAAKGSENAITIRAVFVPIALAVCGIFGGMYIQGTRAEERIAELTQKVNYQQAKIDTLNNKVIAIEATSKAAETLQRMEERQEKMLQLIERRLR